MATITLNRSDVFPVGTTVSVRAYGAKRNGQAPSGPELASGTVAADGTLSITDSDVVSYRNFTLYAEVDGEHRYLDARSTLDTYDNGTFVATGTLIDGNFGVELAVTEGTPRVGQRIIGAGIPLGAYITTVSLPVVIMSVQATASASDVPIRGESAHTWQAKVRRRRIAMGTS